MEKALELAGSRGWAAVFVLGDPGYYERFGFSSAAASGFSSPYAGPHFMMLKLSPSLTRSEGELRHPAAFSALG
jgi:putative acetyltransferase